MGNELDLVGIAFPPTSSYTHDVAAVFSTGDGCLPLAFSSLPTQAGQSLVAGLHSNYTIGPVNPDVFELPAACKSAALRATKKQQVLTDQQTHEALSMVMAPFQVSTTQDQPTTTCTYPEKLIGMGYLQ